MTTREKALELVRQLISAEVEVVKQSNFRRGGLTKSAANQERKAVDAIFEALTGTALTAEEFQDIAA